MNTRTAKTGFTLIELLVVIAIIAILAAILFPVFASAREKGRQTACESNEKQLGLAFLQYCQDYDEYIPFGNNGGWWCYQIYPYVKSTGAYYCPSDTTTAVAPKVTISYAYNQNLSSTYYPVLSTTHLNAPSSTVLLCEAGTQTGNLALSTTNFPVTEGYAYPSVTGVAGNIGGRASTLTTAMATRHTSGSNFLAVDGHVKFLLPQMVSSGIDPLTYGKNPNCGQDHSGASCTTYPFGEMAAGTGGLGTQFTMTFSST